MAPTALSQMLTRGTAAFSLVRNVASRDVTHYESSGMGLRQMRALLSSCLLLAATSCVDSPTSSVSQHIVPPDSSHLSLFVSRDRATGDIHYQLDGKQKERDAILVILKTIASKDADQLLGIKVEGDLPAHELMSLLEDLARVQWKRVRINGLLEGSLLTLQKPSELLPIDEKQP